MYIKNARFFISESTRIDVSLKSLPTTRETSIKQSTRCMVLMMFKNLDQ